MKLQPRRRTLRGVALVAALSILGLQAAVSPSAVTAATMKLPGGTQISVTISTPAAGSTIPSDQLVAGTAEVGPQSAASTNLIYVLDVSASTQSGAACGGDANLDGYSNVLDCEVAGLLALNAEAVEQSSINRVAAISFADLGQIADLDPLEPKAITTTPGADLNGNTIPDVVEVLRSARNTGGSTGFQQFTPADVGIATDFEVAVQRIGTIAPSVAPGARVIVAFISDGVATRGGSALDDASALPAGVDIHTFAAGGSSSCTNAGDSTTSPETPGSLQQIAELTGGTCARVTDPGDLASLVPEVIVPELSAVDVSIDNGTPIHATTSVALPASGPVGTNWSVQLSDLAPGPHAICATATGSDNGGTGTVEDCRTVTVESTPDNDGDGTPDAEDTDDDNDGISDADEIAAGSDPNSADSSPEVCDGADNDADGTIDDGFPDSDADGQADCTDTDDDNDGISDEDESSGGSDPTDPGSTPEACDGVDNDGDGDVDEGFADTDGDTTADCVDVDDDGDGTSDGDEAACGSDPLDGGSACPTLVFTGFSAPVDNAPVLNVANAGRTIPLKYRLTTPDGTPVSDPASFVKITSAKAPCGALDDAGSDTLESYAGSSGVQYLGDGYWQVNWATSKSYSGTANGPCRVLTLELADGSTHTANFRFK